MIIYYLITIMWQACKKRSVIPALQLVPDGQEPITHFLNNVLEWYPISSLWSHAHITPLLYHQFDPSMWAMIILNQSCVSMSVWILSGINVPAPSTYSNHGPTMLSVVSLQLSCFQYLLLYSNALSARNGYISSWDPRKYVGTGSGPIKGKLMPTGRKCFGGWEV